MNRQALVAGIIALALVGAVIGGILYSTRKNRIGVDGQILKVRSHELDPASTSVVVDFRLTNPSDHGFVVRDVEAYLDTKDGKTLPGDIFSEIDSQRMLDYYKMLGPKHNQTLIRRDSVNSRQSLDRMIAVRFNTSDAEVQARKAIRLIITETDRAKSEVIEMRK